MLKVAFRRQASVVRAHPGWRLFLDTLRFKIVHMNFADRFPLAPILRWAAQNNIDLSSWKTWGATQPEYISHAALHRLFMALEPAVAAQAVGLQIGRECELSTLGLFGEIGRHSRTLRDASSIFMRHQSFSTHIQTHVEFDAATGHAAIVVPLNPDPAFSESLEFRLAFAFVQTINILRQILDDPQLKPAIVEFAHEDARFADAYAQYFGCPIKFGAPRNRIAFLSEVFDRPIPGAVSNTRAFLEEFAMLQAERAGATGAGNTDFVALVRAELLDAIPTGSFDAETVARRLSVSARTLQRRLTAEGCAYRDLVDDVRAQMALELLAQSELSTEEIAFRLGYTRASSFNRAFKRWTGNAPGEVRSDLRS